MQGQKKNPVKVCELEQCKAKHENVKKVGFWSNAFGAFCDECSGVMGTKENVKFKCACFDFLEETNSNEDMIKFTLKAEYFEKEKKKDRDLADKLIENLKKDTEKKCEMQKECSGTPEFGPEMKQMKTCELLRCRTDYIEVLNTINVRTSTLDILVQGKWKNKAIKPTETTCKAVAEVYEPLMSATWYTNPGDEKNHGDYAKDHETKDVWCTRYRGVWARDKNKAINPIWEPMCSKEFYPRKR